MDFEVERKVLHEGLDIHIYGEREREKKKKTVISLRLMNQKDKA